MVISETGALEEGGNKLDPDELDDIIEEEVTGELDCPLDDDGSSLEMVETLDAFVVVDKLETLSSEDERISSLDEFTGFDEVSITVDEVGNCEGKGKSHALNSKVV